MSVNEEIEDIIKIIALRNATEYDGKAKFEVVMGRTIANSPHLKDNLKNLLPTIKAIVQNINSMSFSEQKALLEEIMPQEAPKKKQTEVYYPQLPPLIGAKEGEVVTRFPPEPNGYPHIGHAKAAIIDEEYARMYSGKLILRFDDTNPLNEKLEYYDAIIEGLEWLGVKPDIIKNTSDDIEILYDYGRKLILANGAYVCTCKQKAIQELRAKGLPCGCRKLSDISLDRLQKMFDGSFNENDAIIRFKGDMASKNTAMRDPTLFRIIDAYHPKLANKIRVWPTYDFAAPIEDSLDGVTHAMRTKEYELRSELYFAILDRLRLRKPMMLEFSRLELNGIPVSKRKIKPLIDQGIVKNWDDPRLPTLVALKRRGFLPQAIRKFVLSLGVTLAETKPPFETLEAFNRQLLDPLSIRLFFVKDPVELHIKNTLPVKEVILKNHPNANFGYRKIEISDSFYISRDDAEKLNVNDEIRLIELHNIRITEIKTDNHNNPVLISTPTGDELKRSMSKIQWVAKDNSIPFKIIIARDLYKDEKYNPNSLELSEGLAESFVSTMTPGTSIQFVRFGFCRIDSNNSAVFTHK